MKSFNNNNNYIVSREYREVSVSPMVTMLGTVLMAVVLLGDQLLWGQQLKTWSDSQMTTFRHNNPSTQLTLFFQVSQLLCNVVTVFIPLRMLLVFPKDQLRLFSLLLFLNLVTVSNSVISMLLHQPRPFWEVTGFN